MSLLNVDKVDPSTGTTLTLGTSGDTVSIPSGVTLSGAGTITASAANLAASGAGGVTGTLPIANGGTASTSTTYCDLTSNVTGNLPVGNLNSGTSASSSTFWRGDGTWVAPSGGAALTGSTDNTVVTVTGADAIQGEANLTFDGTLTVTGRTYVNQEGIGGNTECLKMRKLNSFGEPAIRLICDQSQGADDEKETMFIHGHRYYGSGYNSQLCINNRAAGGIQFDIGGVVNSTENTALEIDSDKDVDVPNALSKGSGSFKIPHPLPSLTATHHLVHSFVESPRTDLLYRGKVTLVSGSATINIDTAVGMTEGTFVALCDDIQCFTTNESDWDVIKGSVSGNILTIESQNPECNAEISWMVLGDRKDEHIMNTKWTDENGKPILEPLRPIDEDPESPNYGKPIR